MGTDWGISFRIQSHQGRMTKPNHYIAFRWIRVAGYSSSITFSCRGMPKQSEWAEKSGGELSLEHWVPYRAGRALSCSCARGAKLGKVGREVWLKKVLNWVGSLVEALSRDAAYGAPPLLHSGKLKSGWNGKIVTKLSTGATIEYGSWARADALLFAVRGGKFIR